jgi:hypothetical protein
MSQEIKNDVKKLDDTELVAQVEGGMTVMQKGTCGSDMCSGSATTAKVQAM